MFKRPTPHDDAKPNRPGRATKRLKATPKPKPKPRDAGPFACPACDRHVRLDSLVEACEACGQAGCLGDHRCEDKACCQVCCRCLLQCPHCGQGTCADGIRCTNEDDCASGAGFGFCAQAADGYRCVECKDEPYTEACAQQGHDFVCGVYGHCRDCEAPYGLACRAKQHGFMCARCAGMLQPPETA